jgi:hypothetical protein
MKKYDFIDSYIYKLNRVKLNNKWGFINEKFEEICEIKYDYIGIFSSDIACVYLNNKCGFINKQCQEICDIKYDACYNFTKNNIAFVKLNDKWGVINSKGEEIIELKYNYDELDNILTQYIKNKERNLKLKKIQ